MNEQLEEMTLHLRAINARVLALKLALTPDRLEVYQSSIEAIKVKELQKPEYSSPELQELIERLFV